MSGLSLTLQGAKQLLETHPSLASKTFPLEAPGRTVCLASGRRLGYNEYIDPAVPVRDLQTVILLPGCPGTRLFTHPSIRRRGWVNGWRLIVLERPGIGLSDPAPTSYTYTDWMADFREFCALLQLSRLAVIGYSAGTPFATAVACMRPATGPQTQSPPGPETRAAAGIPGEPPATDSASAPSAAAGTAPIATAAVEDAAATGAATSQIALAVADGDSSLCEGALAGVASGGAQGTGGHSSAEQACGRTALAPSLSVDGVALISAIGPPDTPNKARGMALLFQFAYWACANLPWLVGWVVRSEAVGIRRRPVTALRKAFAPYSGKADVAALKRPEVEELFLESALEMYSRGQEESVLRENLMFAGRPWGFDLSGCCTRVAIWQGGQDRGCTPAMASHLAACMGTERSEPHGGGPGRAVTLNLLAEKGHMLYFDVWDEVVAWVNGLVAHGPDAAPSL